MMATPVSSGTKSLTNWDSVRQDYPLISTASAVKAAHRSRVIPPLPVSKNSAPPVRSGAPKIGVSARGRARLLGVKS